MKIVLRSARALVFAVAAIGASAQEVPPEVQSVALEFLRGIEEGSLALGDSSSILASRARSAMAEGAFRSAGERLKAELGTARSRERSPGGRRGEAPRAPTPRPCPVLWARPPAAQRRE